MQLGRKAAAVGILSIIGFTYFASVAITAGPITPLSLELTPAASKVIRPYLVQNWKLFAPDPISEERGLVARARCSDGTETEFLDITTPHIQDIHETRLFPSRISRLVSNGMFNLFVEDPYLSRYRQTSDDPTTSVDTSPTESDPDLLALSDAEVEMRRQGEIVMARFAAWSLQDECADVVEVQLRYVLHSFPRWSDRENWRAEGDINILESQWFPAE